MSFVMSHEALGFPGISGCGFQSRITTERETDGGATLLKGAVQEVLKATPLHTKLIALQDLKCLHW